MSELEAQLRRYAEYGVKWDVRRLLIKAADHIAGLERRATPKDASTQPVGEVPYSTGYADGRREALEEAAQKAIEIAKICAEGYYANPGDDHVKGPGIASSNTGFFIEKGIRALAAIAALATQATATQETT